MKVNGFLFLILAIGLILGSVAIYAYVQAMSPVWADIAQKQAQQDLDTKKQNDEIQIHEEIQRAADWTEVQRMVLVIAAVGFGGWVFYLMWERKDRRKESWARAVDGTFALQTVTNGETVWVVDPNKLGGDAVGLNKSTGLLGEHASQFLGPDRQLTQNLAIQKTRTVSAASSQPIKYAAHAKMLAGGYDREPRQIAQTPAHDDGDPMPIDFKPLTVQDAIAQSTPDSWVLGQNQETGELFTLNIRKVVHLGIVGATGTGKTMYVALLMMINAIRSKWRVIILDGKGGADWSKFGQYVEYYALDYTNVGAMLKQITDEYNQRQAKLNAAQANSVWELTPTPRPTMVLVDEFGAVMDSLKVASPAEHKKVSLDLGNLLRLSRSTGISMVFCDQDPSKWPSAMRANLPVNICFRLGGMKGNSVSEFNLHELDRVAHFQVNGERFHALPTYRVIDSVLPSIEYKKPKALLAAPLSVRLSVDGDGGNIEDLPPSLTDRRTDGQADITSLQAAVLQWRRDNPNGIQADCIRAMAAQGLTLSRQYASDLWKIQLGASPMAWQEEGENEE